MGVVLLGCPKNRVDGEGLMGRLRRRGFTLTAEAHQADVLLVSTCAFVQDAVEEAVEVLVEMEEHRRSGPCQQLLVIGCLPQRYGSGLDAEFPLVDGFFGVGQEDQVLAALDRRWSATATSPGDELGQGAPSGSSAVVPSAPALAAGRVLSTLPFVAYLKIAEGCAHRCAYCVIPRLRGPLTSRPAAQVMAEARQLAEYGVRELVLVAQDTTSYGRDGPDGAPRLASLLRDLDDIRGLEWVRLLYAHPAHVTIELMEVMATAQRILPYLDLPIQHADPAILRAMGRTPGPARLIDLVASLRERIPGMVLRSTVMVGYPGETDRAFGRLREFLGQVEFDHLGVFCYSDEEGTRSCQQGPKVPRSVAQERRHQLMTLQAEISLRHNRGRVGQLFRAVVEGCSLDGGRMVSHGRAWFQAPEIDGKVLLPGLCLQAGRFLEVEATDAEPYDLVVQPTPRPRSTMYGQK